MGTPLEVVAEPDALTVAHGQSGPSTSVLTISLPDSATARRPGRNADIATIIGRVAIDCGFSKSSGRTTTTNAPHVAVKVVQIARYESDASATPINSELTPPDVGNGIAARAVALFLGTSPLGARERDTWLAFPQSFSEVLSRGKA